MDVTTASRCVNTTANRADIYSTFTNVSLTQDSQNEAAVHYLDGYIMIRRPYWAKAFYRDISTSTRVGTDT